jgi:hypothetical protein
MKSGLEGTGHWMALAPQHSHHQGIIGEEKSPIMFDAGFVNFLLPFVCGARKKHKRIFGPNQFVNYSLAGIRS